MIFYKFISLPNNNIGNKKSKRAFYKLLNSIKHSKIYLSPPYAFNDPYDGRFIAKTLSPELVKFITSSKEELINDYKGSLFAKDLSNSPVNVLPTNTFLVASFANESILHPSGDDKSYCDLMWAHYANNHYGVCLQYDFNIDSSDIHSIKNNLIPNGDPILWHFSGRKTPRPYNPLRQSQSQDGLQVFWKKTNYDMDENAYDFPDPNSRQIIDITRIVSTKPAPWSYEQESRLIVQAPSKCAFSPNDTFYVQYKPSCLRAIILGYRTLEEYRNKICTFITQNDNEDIRGIKLYKSQLDLANYTFEYSNLE